MDEETTIARLNATVSGLERDVRSLADQIAALEKKVGVRVSQLTYPVDPLTQAIIDQGKPVFVSFTSGSAGTNGYILVNVNGVAYKLMTTA